MADSSGKTGNGGDANAERLAAARRKFTDAVDGVTRKAQGASDKVREEAGRAGDAARERFDSAKDGVRHGYDRVTKDLDQLTQDVNEYVRHNPGKSIAIAAGLGFFVGLLLRGRRG